MRKAVVYSKVKFLSLKGPAFLKWFAPLRAPWQPRPRDETTPPKKTSKDRDEWVKRCVHARAVVVISPDARALVTRPWPRRPTPTPPSASCARRGFARTRRAAGLGRLAPTAPAPRPATAAAPAAGPKSRPWKSRGGRWRRALLSRRWSSRRSRRLLPKEEGRQVTKQKERERER